MNDLYTIGAIFIGSAVVFWIMAKQAKPGREDERGFHTDYDGED
jgi:hypothetical protein